MRHGLLLLALLFTVGCLAAQESKPLSAEEKKAAVERIGSLLAERYVFEDIGKQCSDHLRKQLAAGVFDKETTTQGFADALTKELQSVSHDKHMRVRPMPGGPGPQGPGDPLLDAVNFRLSRNANNNGVARVEVLEGNIGLLDIRNFPPAELARGTVTAALKVLENVDALIVDLRRNGGGNPDLIRYYCSFFMPPNTHINSLYWRERDRTQEFRTLEAIDGKRRTDVPVFVLTSNRTFSGGEEFAYNFKTQKRATLIGEVTGGGANPGGMFPVNERLGIFIPTGRAINPITGTNWEGVGVEPDIKTTADEALEKALPLAKEAAVRYAAEQRRKAEETVRPIRTALEKAEKLVAEGKTGEAQKVLEPALDKGLEQGVVTEMSVNMLGYASLQKNSVPLAIELFLFNVKRFPQSANVYDSYGEALMKAGRTEEAIRNYRKSLELDPTNENARTMIRRMTDRE